MKTTRTQRVRRAAWSAVSAVSVAAAALAASAAGAVASPASGGANPVVRTDDGLVRGAAVSGVDSFLGLPYAAPPTGNLRWRPPQPAAAWSGVRDATQFGPSCPQATTQNPYLPPGPISENCLYLNVYTPTSHSSGSGRPVLVWIHGGGLTVDGARNYDGTKLAADGTVVVTIDYRLGALGFLAHPALASHGAAGNYGLMDQQAALRWVQRNIARFGGDPGNVTIAGQSAGGLSVLAQMVSPGARGLFQRAIVQSGTFALNQRPLAVAEAAGETFATAVGCADQSAACLRSAPVSDLVANFGVEIPGVVDGAVLTQPIGTALARGQFARVPMINGITHDEELLFVDGLKLTVSQGTNIPLAAPLDGSETTYEADIAQALGVSPARAAAIAAVYPLSANPTRPDEVFGLAVSDASFACPALQVDRQTAARGVPTYAYQFNDDAAPGFGLGQATHGAELPYLFDLPNMPVTLNPDQQALAASMRTDWARFAGTGDPSSRALPWPSFGGTRVLSLVPLQSQVTTDFAAEHHCSFWAAG
jgi:para-nitrobenzyl esterase